MQQPTLWSRGDCIPAVRSREEIPQEKGSYSGEWLPETLPMSHCWPQTWASALQCL